MIWERFYELCISTGAKPNPVAKDLGISDEIIHMINYKYVQYQKKREKLLSASEASTNDGFQNMLA